MSTDRNLESVLSDHIKDPSSGWSMGSFGALAEFLQDEGEPIVVDEIDALTCRRSGAANNALPKL